MIIGSRVLERMNACNLSQAALARSVQLSQPTIHGLIHSNKIGSKHIHRIARVLRTTPAYLMGETDDPGTDAVQPLLNPDEERWLSYWRSLNVDERDALVRVARLLIGERGPSTPVARAA